MKRRIFLICTSSILILSACYNVRIKKHDEWKQYFDEAGVEGCFEFFDNNKEVAHYYNLEFCGERKVPGATFHTLLAVTALDNGLAPDELYTIPWDGQFRKQINGIASIAQDTTESGYRADWSEDLTMSDAFKNGSAYYWGALAARLGTEEVKKAIDTVRYGNATMDTTEYFWSNGSLQISPDEQVGYIKRLYHAELPYSERAQRIVKNMMQQEKNELYSLNYTVAQVLSADAPIYWIVGYVEKINVLKHIETKEDQYIPHPYFFALAIQGKDKNADLASVGKKLLEKLMLVNNLDNNSN